MNKEFIVAINDEEYILLDGALDDSKDYYLNKKENAESDGKDAEAERMDYRAQRISELQERITHAYYNKPRGFTEEQLYLLRDTFAELASNEVERGNLDEAQENLDIVNTVQSQLEEDEYEDLRHFLLLDGGTWQEMDERELEDFEEELISSLVKWSKSDETEPAGQLKDSLRDYLKGTYNYERETEQKQTKARLSALNTLVAICSRDCTEEQTYKLLSMVKGIVTNL